MDPVYTYDPTTPLGQVRLLIADTDTAAAAFSDQELTALLTQLAGSNVQIAASLALEALAGDAAKLAIRVKTQNSDTDSSQLAVQLRAQAQELRRIAQGVIVVNAPDQAFRPSYGNGTTPGNLCPW